MCSICNKEDIAINIQQDDSRLRAFYISNSKESYSDYVLNGFLKTYNATRHFNIFEADQEYFEDKTSDFKNRVQTEAVTTDENSARVVGINTRVFKDEEIDILKQKVNPAQGISKGFSIKVKSQPADLLTSIDEQLKRLTNENIEQVESAFMAHHLDCGYRIDVKVATLKDEFRSLCRRKAKYAIDGKNFVLFESLEDEPWLEEVRQIDDDGKEARFEEITRWNGWSVTCPPLYANKSPANDETDDLELTEIFPIELPKLRFGNAHNYQFAIRTVDICGNGPAITNDETNKDCIFPTPTVIGGPAGDPPKKNPPIIYTRRESIGAPLFFPTDVIIQNIDDEKNDNKKIKKQYKGEDNETLVIRTRVDRELSATLVADNCVRYITPQYITAHFAEASGLYETKDTGALYALLKEIPKHAYKEDEIENGIPFATDNLVQKIAVSDAKGNFIKAIPFDKPAGTLRVRPIKFTLAAGQLSSADGVLNIPISEGDYKTLQVQSLDDGEMKSAPKEFRIVHAVQRPKFAGKDFKVVNEDVAFDLSAILFFQKRQIAPGDYADGQQYEVLLDKIKLKQLEGIFPFSTTGEIIVTAEYPEYELNPDNPNGWSYKTATSNKKNGRYGTNDMKDADKVVIRKSWSNFDEKTPGDLLDTILKDSPDEKIFENELQLFSHQFPDTKFRTVNYTLEAISKFSEYFDPETHGIGTKDASPFSTFATLDGIKENNSRYTIIQNSSKPSKPTITAIVPIFTIDEKTADSYHFKHNTFRLYLGSSWYETGLQESIAVVYPIVNKTEEETWYKNKISIIAKDPTVPNSAVLYSDSVNTYIDSARTKDSVNVFILDKTADSLKRDMSTNDPEKSAFEKINARNAFSVFKVKWDARKKEFYADISLKELNLIHYSTMVKFGVCRYQENSIAAKDLYDFRFSDVVMTDMQTLFPDRKINIAKKTIDVLGKPGSRGVDNIFYLLAEQSAEIKPGVSPVDTAKRSWNTDIYRVINYDFNVLKNDLHPGTISFDEISKNANSIFIEEYEQIPVGEVKPAYDPIENPRSDPGKRLVFFYKIK